MYEKYFTMAQVECENEVFKNLVIFFWLIDHTRSC